MNFKNIPEKFIDFITGKIMEDPVLIIESGQNYDLASITKWLETNEDDPIIPNIKIRSENFILNTSLKEEITQWKSNYKSGKRERINDTICDEEVRSITKVSRKEETLEDKKLDVRAIFYNNTLLLKIKSQLKTYLGQYINLVCIIDTSGSMSNILEITNNKSEKIKIMVIDLVKHSILTLIESLDEYDRLSIVLFNDSSEILCNLTSMNPLNKESIKKKLETVTCKGNTNIEDGLITGMSIIKDGIDKKNIPKFACNNILLFTDGIATSFYEPKNGYKKMLENYLLFNSFNCTINTFGFGNDINSDILKEISDVGMGSFNFIEDISMVGTIFVNFIALLLNMISTCVIVTVNKKIIKIGQLILEQSRDIIIENIKPEDLRVKIEYHNPFTNKYTTEIHNFNFKDNIINNEDIMDLIINTERIKTCELLLFILNNYDENKIKQLLEKRVLEILEQIEFLTILDNNNEKFISYLRCLIYDIEGKITKAIKTEENYNKWGAHYIKSIETAHSKQICNNFRDKGVQKYGNELFYDIRDEIGRIFIEIPPPLSLSVVKDEKDSYDYNNKISITHSMSLLYNREFY